MYVVLALFMLMGIIQKPTLQSYFSKIVFWWPQSLVQLFPWISLNQSAILCISTTMIIQEHTREHLNFSKSCGAPNVVKMSYVLKNVSKHSTQSYIF